MTAPLLREREDKWIITKWWHHEAETRTATIVYRILNELILPKWKKKRKRKHWADTSDVKEMQEYVNLP